MFLLSQSCVPKFRGFIRKLYPSLNGYVGVRGIGLTEGIRETVQENIIFKYNDVQEYRTKMRNDWVYEFLNSSRINSKIFYVDALVVTEIGERFKRCVITTRDDSITYIKTSAFNLVLQHSMQGQLGYLKLVDEYEGNNEAMVFDIYFPFNKDPEPYLSDTEELTIVGLYNTKHNTAVLQCVNMINDSPNFLTHPTKLLEVIKSSQDEPTEECLVRDISTLNDSQRYAISRVLQNQLTIIQGPPGTGKTVVCAHIVKELVDRLGHKVLICAHSNTAVDNICDKLSLLGLKFHRYCSKHLWDNKKYSIPGYSPYAIRDRVSKLDDQELVKIIDQLTINKNYFLENNQLSLLLSHEFVEIGKADIVVCTIGGCHSTILGSLSFDSILIDEASQPFEQEVLLPLSLVKDKYIFVGDHQQLGPSFKSNELYSNISLFERIIKLDYKPVMLNTQYRMHPALSEFSAEEFYEGKLVNGLTEFDRKHTFEKFAWPKTDVPMFFIDCKGEEFTTYSGFSKYNIIECTEVLNILEHMLNAGINPDSIGIITPYSAQREKIKSMIFEKYGSGNDNLNIEVASLNAYQGREKDYIIISCVRSNTEQVVGFLSDARRLNVAITRAKYGMVIVGDSGVLREVPVWDDYLNFFEKKGVLFKGSFPYLEQIDSSD